MVLFLFFSIEVKNLLLLYSINLINQNERIQQTSNTKD